MSVRTVEVYQLCCCGVTFELPAALVDATGTFTCEKCGRVAKVEWAEARKA